MKSGQLVTSLRTNEISHSDLETIYLENVH
jgi:hypothetical protein